MQLIHRDNPILHRVCRPSFVLDADVIQQMFYLLGELGGLGLAANQVGIDARLFVTAWGEVFVNPGILRVEGQFVSAREGCLSLPGVTRFKSRCQKIVLAGGDIYEGQQAVVIQHEIDHLNGILIIDEQ
jgi:peptide deformylase